MKKYLKNLDYPLLIIAIVLFAIGLLMIFSSSNIIAITKKASGTPYSYFLKQSIFIFLGIVFSLIILFLNTKWYRFIGILTIILSFILLIGLFFIGKTSNGARSWYDFKFFTFQPSEVAKMAIIVYLGTYYEYYKARLDKYIPSFFSLLFPILLFGLVLIQPDLGTAAIIAILVYLIFTISPIAKKIKNQVHLILGMIVLIIGLSSFSGNLNINKFLLEHQKERFDFSNPCSKEKFYSYGNQLCNSYIAINKGGLTGVGLGNSTQKYLYLPEAHTDFIFSIIMEELGLILSSVILLLYFLLISRIIKIARESVTNRGAIICFGIAMYILIHIIVNLTGIFGLLPMTGVPLPFMSYGGTFVFMLIVSLAIVQRFNIENKLYLQNK